MAKQTPKDESAMPYSGSPQSVMLTPQQLMEMGYHMASDGEQEKRSAPASVWKEYDEGKTVRYALARPLDVETSIDRGMSALEVIASLSKEEIEVWTESLPLGQLTSYLDNLSPSAFGFHGTATKDRAKDERLRYAVKCLRDEAEERGQHLRTMRPIAYSEQAREDGRVGKWGFSTEEAYPYTVNMYYRTIGIRPNGAEVRIVVPGQHVPDDVKKLIEDMIDPERQRYLTAQAPPEQDAMPAYESATTEPEPAGEGAKRRERGPGLGRPGDGRVSALGEALGKGGH